MTQQSRILDAISSPSDLHLLSTEELEILCSELREEIVQVTSKNGGHVGASLGAVEIIVALHSLLNTPTDRIVFDVGHQAYAHKLLTGRKDQFSTLRQFGGISGFTKACESPYDVHPSGHASDSISIALGLAEARQMNGSNEKIVAVIGDAALSGGMAFEALNHIGQEQIPIVIVLNDNGFSISRPTGALVRHLGYLRASKEYRATREALQDIMENSGPVSKHLLGVGKNVKESIKQFFVPSAMMFESLGITCTAPIDGHDLTTLRETFQVALESSGPVFVHVVTQKGAGYEPAVQNPELFHGVGPYDIATGKVYKNPDAKPTYTKVFGQALLREADRDHSICALTAAMKDGTGLKDFSEKYPARFFDTGITEEHAVGLAAGLSFGGKKPVVCIYSTFLQRALDQIIIDNTLGEANTVFCIDRGGLVGDDGPTHHGTFDLVYLRMIPGMRVLTPSNEAELVHALHTALMLEGPVALRYPRGEARGVAIPDEPQMLEVGKSVETRSGDEVALLAFGRMVAEAEAASDLLRESGISARVVDMRWVKPLDEEAIRSALDTKLVITLEEGVTMGGVGEEISRMAHDMRSLTPVVCMGLPDAFIPQGKIPQLFAYAHIDAASIAQRVKDELKKSAE